MELQYCTLPDGTSNKKIVDAEIYHWQLSSLYVFGDEYPHLYPLYDEIYNKGKRAYWENLNREIAQFCAEQELEYLINDDSQQRGINEPPIVVNYFYHEEITR